MQFNFSALTLGLKQKSLFVSPKIVVLLGSSVGLSLIVVVTEVLFPFTLQALLFHIGVSPQGFALSTGFMTDWSTQLIVISLLAVSLTKSLVQGVLMYLSCSITQSFRYYMRAQMAEWLLRGLRISQASFVSLFGEKTNATGELLLDLQAALINIVMSLAFLVLLLKFSPVITVVTMLLLVLVNFPLRMIMKKINENGEQINRRWDKLNQYLVLIFKNVFFLRLYGLEKDILKVTNSELHEFLRSYLRFISFSAISTFLPQFTGIVILVLICILGHTYKLLDQALLIPYLYLFFRFTQVISAYFRQHSNIVFRLKQSKDLYTWWDENINKVASIQVTSIETSTLQSIKTERPFGWKLDHITFKYPDNVKPVFENFTLNIPAGKVTVITGQSGRGKSTLINLLVGELKPQSGSVNLQWLDSQMPKNLSIGQCRAAIQSSFGYVSSENFLFSGTIEENLLFGLKTEPTQDEMMSALRQSNCEFLLEQPERLKSSIGDYGEGLSGGQRQRLCLARTLLRKPLVLILDEATSNLDVDSQSHFIETLRQLHDITILIVTHRLELLSLADQHIDLEK